MENYASLSDEALVTASQEKDDFAFHELARRYAESIFNFVLQYTKDRDDAEDVAQDAFFKTWKHIRRFKAGGKWRPWLYAIARNTALDHVKKKKAFPFSVLDNEETDVSFAETLEDTEPLQDEVFEKSLLAAEIAEIMTVLHPDHGAVLLMHYRDLMTFDEIATVIGKPMNTIKSWHRRALQKLHKELAHRRG